MSETVKAWNRTTMNSDRFTELKTQQACINEENDTICYKYARRQFDVLSVYKAVWRFH